MESRLPGQGDGPDAISAHITATSITAIRPAVRQAVLYDLADLPSVIAGSIIVDAETGEWIWCGRIDRDGYGRSGSEGAHRAVYKLLVGEIPAGLELDHVKAWGCTSRACVSPWCLEPVTKRENTLRGNSFAAVNARKIQCDHGHWYTPANTYRRPDGHRDCRACVRRRVRQYKRRLRQAEIMGQLELGQAA